MEYLEKERGTDELFEVALHVLHHDVQLSEVLGVCRFDDLYDLDDTRVVHLSHESDLSENALAVNVILEDVLHALYRHLLSRAELKRAAYAAVRARAENALHLIV